MQQLLENAKLDGYQEGFEQGHRTGRKTWKEEGKEHGYNKGYEEESRKWMESYKAGYDVKGKLDQEKEERACKEGQLKGYKLGIQQGKNDK